MTNNMSKPLVSYVVFAYNHEDFIESAVESALAQSYSPLEIILTDDCSSDRTFEIMQDVVSRYEGPHVVRLNRNPENLGLAKHFNKIMRLCSGDFVLTAGGDDISDPGRTDALVTKWIGLGRIECSIFSNATVIDEKGASKGLYYKDISFSKNISDFIEKKVCWVGGFSHGFSKALFSKYGSMPDGTFQEDGVIAFRAILCGGIYFLDQDLVRYRRHENNSYSTASYLKFKKLCESELSLANGRIRDIQVTSSLSENQKSAALKILKAEARKKMYLSSVPGLARLFFELKKAKGALKKVL